MAYCVHSVAFVAWCVCMFPFCSIGVLGVWIVGFQMGWFARLPLSFSFLDVVMLFIGRRVLLDDIVFVCLSVGITDVFVCFFRGLMCCVPFTSCAGAS